MDLATLDVVSGANAGFEIQLFHPVTSVDLDVFITVLGRDSGEFTKLQNDQLRKRAARVGKGGFRTQQLLSPEEQEQDKLELLVACTKSWRDDANPVLTFSGTEYECTPQNALKIYKDYPWIREQVEAGVADREKALTAVKKP